MMRIFTRNYTELDLRPDSYLQFDLENPMLGDECLPTAFSTRIAFPPSPANRRVFGYTPAMAMPPSEQSVMATVWIGGVPFISGTLVYDGIEDGDLQYTFTQKIEGTGGKIWDQEILKFKTGELPEDRPGIFRTPLTIRKNNVAMQPYLEGLDDENLKLKFWNYRSEAVSLDYGGFLPAVAVGAALGGLKVSVPSSLEWILSDLHILGRFHEYVTGDVVVSSGGRTTSSGPRTSSGASSTRTGLSAERVRTSVVSGESRRDPDKETDIASFLPDITFLDLLQGIGRMFCASFFIEDGALVMVPHADILSAGAAIDLTGKVSDDMDCSVEPAASYSFGYGDESEGSSQDLLAGRSGAAFVTAGDSDGFHPDIILDRFGSSGAYGLVYDQTTGDIYSGRGYKIYGGIAEIEIDGKPLSGTLLTELLAGFPTVYDCDVVFHNAKKVESAVDYEDSESRDGTTGFRLPRCVPEKIFPNSAAGTRPADTEAAYRMVPVAEPNTVSEGRDTKVYIGVIGNSLCQLTDHDRFQRAVWESREQGIHALTPPALWEKHHKDFAAWLATRRQTVSADLDLTPSELSDMKLSRPVYFHGRRWVVKKLSVTAGAASGIEGVRGEFVEI